MPDAASEFDVHHLASLARLSLTPGEAAAFTRQLGDILDYAAQLRSVDTTDVPPMTQVLNPALEERADEPAPSLSTEDALRNAPETNTNLFRVPRVLG
jgi:aspartyl-tRNA(Asn)/glutamyl-tRNA(Gln) amidotransferase subunit C